MPQLDGRLAASGFFLKKHNKISLSPRQTLLRHSGDALSKREQQQQRRRHFSGDGDE